jgi:inosine-uridine nucleoside N-ribohydrolase
LYTFITPTPLPMASMRSPALVIGGALLLLAGVLAVIFGAISIATSSSSSSSFADAYANYQDSQCPENVKVVRSPAADVRDANAKNIIFMGDFPNMDDMEAHYIFHKSPRAKLAFQYLVGDAFANAGAAFANAFKINHLFGKDLSLPVVAGSLASLNDSATGSLDYLQAVPRGKGGLLDSDNMWSTSHMLQQGSRYYEFLGDLTADEPENPAFFIPSPVSVLALKAYIFGAPPGEVFTLFVSGPMTPIVHLFQNCTVGEKALLTARIEKVVIMGGAVDVHGNVFSRPPFASDFCNLSDPYYAVHNAEFNFYNDPHAAQLGLEYLRDASIPITLVPLDATDKVPYTDAMIGRLTGFDVNGAPVAPGPQTPEAQIVGQAMRNFQKSWFTTGPNEHCFFDGAVNSSCCFFNARGGEGYLWDVTAAIVALYPELVVTNQTVTSLYVQKDGPAFDFGNPGQGSSNHCDPMVRTDCVNVNVVYNVNANAIRQLVEDLLQSPVNSATRQLYCPLP